jgi:N-acyl-D-aspartate/D-glutamate deacylase
MPFGIIGMSPESKLRGLTEDDRALLRMLSIRGHASVNWNPLVHSSSIPDLWHTNLSASEEAKAVGGQVYAVFNPSSTGGNRVDLDTCFLFAALPHWRPIASMPRADKVRAFSDVAVRKELADDLENDSSMGLLTAKLRTMWDILRITEAFTADTRPFVGRLVGDLARETGRTPLDTMLDIAIADDLRTVFMQEDVRTEDDTARIAFEAMAHSPHVMFGGSDAGAHLDMLANESLPARTLEWRVREQGTLRLEEAVRGFTGALADAIGLHGHGYIRPGYAADIIVFDIETIGAGDAHVVHDLPGGGCRMMTEARGVEHTLVAGEVVFDRGKPTGALPGRLLRSGGAGAKES